MNAQELYNFLEELKARNIDLETLEINVRTESDEIEKALSVEEDLFDSETNSILESIAIRCNGNSFNF